MLNESQPVPGDFKAAYERKAPISVLFYEPSQGALYPQGLDVDTMVSNYMSNLRSRYPQIEFFSYNINNPGNAQSSKKLRPGEYGSLAAQLGVGYTPYVVMLAPQGGGYAVENVFEGYVPPPVLSQALFNLAAVSKGGNTSDADVTLEKIKLTKTGGGIECVTIKNQGKQTIGLQGFTLKPLNPHTGQVESNAKGLLISGKVRVGPGQIITIGRTPDVKGPSGKKVAGTFEGGEKMNLSPGDQVALLDSGGAVASTITV